MRGEKHRAGFNQQTEEKHMNKHNAKDYLPLVQAMADGKEVELMHSDGMWIVERELIFTAPLENYRIIEPSKIEDIERDLAISRARCQMLEKAGDLLAIVIGPAGKQAWSTEAEVDMAYYGWLNLRESKP